MSSSRVMYFRKLNSTRLIIQKTPLSVCGRLQKIDMLASQRVTAEFVERHFAVLFGRMVL